MTLKRDPLLNTVTKYVFLLIAIDLSVIPLTHTEVEVDEILINVQQGTLRGKRETGITGDTYYCFKGIPYAKPPLGALRFKAPQPPDSWTGIRDATFHRGISFQESNIATEPAENESEDCLYLNVYTLENPTNSTKKLKPVMFWIHGGAFTSGSGNSETYGPDYLVLEDLILVTINYRLGIFGFLRADDPTLEIPGNAAMKDMVMALEWTKDNIINFGGDPDDITISGQSAGGVATHLLTLSPLASGLFNKAIIDSGSALSMWSLVLAEKRPLVEVAKSLNITYESERQVVEILYELPAKDVIDAQKRVNYTIGDPLFFGPTVETPSNGTPFLTDHPLNIIRSGNYSKVPSVFGYVSREGMMFRRNGLKFLTRDVEDFIPFDWGIQKGSSKSNGLAEQIAKFYYNGESPTEENLDITYTSIREQRKVSHEKIYLYRFSVDGRNNIAKKSYNITLPGVCHGDNNLYRFTRNNTVPEVIPNSIEDLTIKRFVKLCTNFVKYGDPTYGEKSNLINFKWNPVSQDEFTFLELGENLSQGVNSDIQRQIFWDELRQSIEN